MQLNRVNRTADLVYVRNALVSVADKSGLEPFIRELWELIPDVTIYSTGGTCTMLRELARKANRSEDCVRSISSYTGQPEMQGGLVKTLDYRVYLGLLSEQFNEDHQTDLRRTGSIPFDMTVCSFYPFEATAGTGNATLEDLRTNVDIGGPTMVRASAKNFLRVLTLCRPPDYRSVLDTLGTHRGATTLGFRLAMATKAFRYTADYEAAIADHLARTAEETDLYTLYNTEDDQSGEDRR